ncbi:MAG: radical SAM family heme chaperone HemW [Ignavibacteria bacterium]|nr:radical SAM family heme chaperone HemW [Ignavibacteria bacterium]
MSYPGIYIHIPFCRNRCNYCDFYITTRTDIKGRYIDNLIKEFELSAENNADNYFNSIYIGGGTPSLLTPEQVFRIINILKGNYNIQDNSEITLELNPEDITEDENKTIEYRDSGINRISFGLQSSNKDELKFLTRFDDTEKITTALERVLKCFKNASVDIIYSIPGSLRKKLEDTIEKIISLKIPHISAYTLIFEKNTPLYYHYENNRVYRNSDETEAELYEYLSDRLTYAGYNHYEISNYALPGFESIHNLKYWEYNNYLGFGASSHSFFHPRRWKNYSNIIKYNLSLEKNTLPTEETHTLTAEESEREIIFLGLRSKGVNLKIFKKITGIIFEKKYSSAIRKLETGKYGTLDSEYFCLTRKGSKIADEIATKYF